MDAIYRVDGDRAVTSPNAAGPWDAGMQHGSAPAALAVWAAEAIPTPEPMRIARGNILKIKTQALQLPPEVAGQPVELPGPDRSQVDPANFSNSAFVTGISLR